MKNSPPGLLGRQARRLRVLPGGAASIGPAGSGVQSMGTRRGASQSKALYRELRRLTMRGERRLIVRLARSFAHRSSSRANHAARFLGCSGGEGP